MSEETVEIEKRHAEILYGAAGTLRDDIIGGRQWGFDAEESQENTAELDEAFEALRDELGKGPGGEAVTDESPQVVREEETGAFGLYHPEENIIETYIGDDRTLVAGDYYGVNWTDAGREELRTSIRADIEVVRADIDQLRDEDLTETQHVELERLESRLTSYENTLDLLQEVRGDA